MLKLQSGFDESNIMAKNLIADIFGILHQFEIATEDDTKKSILHARETEPSADARLLSFVFNRNKYYILFDERAEDEKPYILSQIRSDISETKGRIVPNPHDETKTYGLRYKQKDVYLFEVASEKKRLDVELSERFPEITRSTLQKYIKAGLVEVNGVVATHSKQDVKGPDEISLKPPVPTDFAEQDLPIIYIDDNVIVVNKPAGVLTHSKGAMNDEFTIADFFRRYTTFGLDTNRPGIIHRLDRDTSGVILGARNEETAAMLKEQFANRKVKKEYIAIVDGVPKVNHALIDLPIARNPKAPSTFRIDPSGKSAITTYEVIASNEHQALVKLFPKTGRTHQLRVHMQYINTPISGDRVYGKIERIDRLYLHAENLEITIPVSSRQTFTAPVPKDFTKHFPGLGDV